MILSRGLTAGPAGDPLAGLCGRHWSKHETYLIVLKLKPLSTELVLVGNQKIDEPLGSDRR